MFEAARQTNKLAIGVDADQYDEAPGYILTSMVKGVDVAVFEAIKRVQGRHVQGRRLFVRAEGRRRRLRLRREQRALIPDAVRARVEALKQEIIAGRIMVPSTR